MKHCKSCAFMSNIKIGATRTCLANSRQTLPDAPACKDWEAPKRDAPKAIKEAGSARQ